MADDKTPNSFGKYVQERYVAEGISENQAAWMCGSLVEVGTLTISATLNNCLFLILSNPECIRLAHKELDRAVGQGRTPTFDDEKSLPYIRGIVKETLRMRPVDTFGNQRVNTVGDSYNDYSISNGTVVVANWWYINFDPEVYRQPAKFLPERWIDYPHSAAEAAALTDWSQKDHLSNNNYWRIYSGMPLAENSLFINIARTLWGFDIALAKDDLGRNVDLDF